jgi:hypothetical protein
MTSTFSEIYIFYLYIRKYVYSVGSAHAAENGFKQQFLRNVFDDTCVTPCCTPLQLLFV